MKLKVYEKGQVETTLNHNQIDKYSIYSNLEHSKNIRDYYIDIIYKKNFYTFFGYDNKGFDYWMEAKRTMLCIQSGNKYDEKDWIVFDKFKYTKQPIDIEFRKLSEFDKNFKNESERYIDQENRSAREVEVKNFKIHNQDIVKVFIKKNNEKYKAVIRFNEFVNEETSTLYTADGIWEKEFNSEEKAIENLKEILGEIFEKVYCKEDDLGYKKKLEEFKEKFGKITLMNINPERNKYLDFSLYDIKKYGIEYKYGYGYRPIFNDCYTFEDNKWYKTKELVDKKVQKTFDIYYQELMKIEIDNSEELDSKYHDMVKKRRRNTILAIVIIVVAFVVYKILTGF